MFISLFNAVFRPKKGVLRRNWKRQSDGPAAVKYH